MIFQSKANKNKLKNNYVFDFLVELPVWLWPSVPHGFIKQQEKGEISQHRDVKVFCYWGRSLLNSQYNKTESTDFNRLK